MTSRILLAEDNDHLAQTLAKFLEARGFAVKVVGNGNEALSLGGSGNLDLMLLDLRLPGLNGPEVLHRLRQTAAGAKLPVIVMSGVYKGEAYTTEMKKLGVEYYLEKPFTPQALLQAVTATLQAAKSSPPAAPAEIVFDIFLNRRTGLLSVGDGSPIAFLDGMPVSVLSKGKQDFVSFLLERGKISLDDFRFFVDAGESRLFLTQTGILSHESLQEESRLFLMKRLLEGMTSPSAAFTDGAPEMEFPLSSLSLPQVSYEMFRNGLVPVDGAAFLATFGKKYPARTVTFYRYINLINLHQADIDLLQRVNGKISLRETISEGGENASFFAFLHALGMLAFHSSPSTEATPDFPLRNQFNRPLDEVQTEEEAAIDFEDLVEEVSETMDLGMGEKVDVPLNAEEINFEQAVLRDHAFLKGKDYYEIFGLTRNTFSFDRLKEAYFKKSKEYSPEKFMMLSGSTQGLAQEILSTLSTAYNTLSNVVSKERYDEMLNADKVGLDGKQDDKLQAQVQLQSGKVFLEMNEFENAQKALQDAYTLNSNSHEATAFLAWAIYRNPTNRGSKAAREKAKSLLSRSLQIKGNADAYAFRGWMLMEEGREELAEGEFQKALKLNPKEKNARKGLAQITEKREAEKKGLFRKFFT